MQQGGEQLQEEQGECEKCKGQGHSGPPLQHQQQRGLLSHSLHPASACMHARPLL